MDPKTARKYLGLNQLPSEAIQVRHWRTREDPFNGVWEQVRQQIEENPGLEAKTLFEWLQREHPGQYQDGQVRTLQRRIKLWRATEGPAQEVYFSQKHEPGRLCASDFTHMTESGITIQGQRFAHHLQEPRITILTPLRRQDLAEDLFSRVSRAGAPHSGTFPRQAHRPPQHSATQPCRLVSRLQFFFRPKPIHLGRSDRATSRGPELVGKGSDCVMVGIEGCGLGLAILRHPHGCSSRRHDRFLLIRVNQEGLGFFQASGLFRTCAPGC